MSSPRSLVRIEPGRTRPTRSRRSTEWSVPVVLPLLRGSDMLIALIVVAVLALGLLVSLVLTRSSAAEFREQAEARETALVTERDELEEKRASLGRELTAARTEVDTLTGDVGTKSAEIARLSEELDKARAVGADRAARIESQSAEIAALVSDHNALQARLETAEAARVAADARADEAEARSTGIVIGDVIVDGPHADALWDLEVARSERTWRTSVAVDPASPQGPFDAADDPLRLAVEIEAAALRENVGAFIMIDWHAAPVDHAARRHLILRVAQEMLEEAARNPEPSRLVASGDDEITLELRAAEEVEDVISIIPPRIASDLIDVKEEAGVSITVKAE